ncbi:MAG TPA: HlyD family efflux transporter periplasmic adaptor subunit [Pseudomonadales bacterium]|nr:HlyD family efflux transporter periplasmic adaptor subunit [Pseudomonadales bacterium]
MKPEYKVWAIRLAVIIAVLAALGQVWRTQYGKVDENNFVQGNGRLEATEVDIATKVGGRVAEIRVNEGDFVKEGDIVAKMDSKSMEAKLAQLNAQVAAARSARETALAMVAQRKADVVMAEAMLTQRQTEAELAKKSNRRTESLLATQAASAQQADDVSARLRNANANIAVAQAQIEAAKAAVNATNAQVEQAQASVDAAEAAVAQLKVELDDCILRAPRSGRIQYRVVQPGEVIGAGGKVLSLVDVGDVYMIFFLPEASAGRVALGTEVHVQLDAAPQYVIPAQISYVASVAQFTPKSVETSSERQKMVFRVKARIDPELLKKYPERVKTGLPGMAYVRLTADKDWPAKWQVKLP